MPGSPYFKALPGIVVLVNTPSLTLNQNNDNQSAAEYSFFLNAFREGERVV